MLGVRAVRDQGVCPETSHLGMRKKGLFTKRDFVCVARNNEYRRPAGERAILRFMTVDYDESSGVLIQCMPELSSEGTMFAERNPPHPTMGARAYT